MQRTLPSHCTGLVIITRRLSPPHLSVSAVDCADPQCGGHGVCVRGECVCSAGWAGVSCDDPLPACQEQCSGHGTYLPESDTCACQPNWTGPDCYTGKNPRITAPPGGGETRVKKQSRKLLPACTSTSLPVFLQHVQTCQILFSGDLIDTRVEIWIGTSL